MCFGISVLDNFAAQLLSVELDDFSINGNLFKAENGHTNSINNQLGYLADENFFRDYLQYTVTGDNVRIPISIQLYENASGHYRIFVYNNKGMLTSVNLSTGYNEGKIDLAIQLKLSSRNMTKEERESNRNLMVADIERESISIIKNNTVYFGTYDISNNSFIGTDPKKFLQELIKVAIIKGHYMSNKGYKLNCL